MSHGILKYLQLRFLCMEFSLLLWDLNIHNQYSYPTYPFMEIGIVDVAQFSVKKVHLSSTIPSLLVQHVCIKFNITFRGTIMFADNAAVS